MNKENSFLPKNDPVYWMNLLYRSSPKNVSHPSRMEWIASNFMREMGDSVGKKVEFKPDHKWIMVSAYSLCPEDLPEMDKMKWMADFFMKKTGMNAMQKVSDVTITEDQSIEISRKLMDRIYSLTSEERRSNDILRHEIFHTLNNLVSNHPRSYVQSDSEVLNSTSELSGLLEEITDVLSKIPDDVMKKLNARPELIAELGSAVEALQNTSQKKTRFGLTS